MVECMLTKSQHGKPAQVFASGMCLLSIQHASANIYRVTPLTAAMFSVLVSQSSCQLMALLYVNLQLDRVQKT